MDALAAVAPSAAAPATAAVAPVVVPDDPELELLDSVMPPLFFAGVSVSGLLAVLFDEDELPDFFASASGAKTKSIAAASTHD